MGQQNNVSFERTYMVLSGLQVQDVEIRILVTSFEFEDIDMWIGEFEVLATGESYSNDMRPFDQVVRK